MPTSPTPIDALPAAPDRADRATFSARATAMFDALKNAFVSQCNAIATNVFNNATEAATSATNAATSASTATTKATEAGASATASGTSATNSASSATTAATSATNAATSASAAATSASNAASDASSVASALASIAGGPVASVNGMTGVVTGIATEAYVTAERTASTTLTSKTIEAGTFTNGYTEETASASGTAFTFAFASGTVQGFTTTGNATITLPAPAAGKSFQIQVAFGGAHTLAFSGGAVGWPDNTTPTFSGASGKTDVLNFVSNVAGTKWLGSIIKGYA